MKKIKFLVLAFAIYSILISTAYAARKKNNNNDFYEYAPTPVMAAYQKAYAMNFEIWKPSNLPAGWYATFDGYPVAQIAENRWVYGQIDRAGNIYPSDILVGSVIPTDIPALVRAVSSWGYGLDFSSKAFLKILKYRCNRMGWYNDGNINTIIAWNSYNAGVWLWMGKRWKNIMPSSGEYMWQTLKRMRPFLAKELYKNKVYYVDGGDNSELANLARQWGMLWAGRVVLERHLTAYNSGGGGSETSIENSSSNETTSLSDNSNNSGGNGNNNNSSGPHWDVD